MLLAFREQLATIDEDENCGEKVYLAAGFRFRLALAAAAAAHFFRSTLFLIKTPKEYKCSEY